MLSCSASCSVKVSGGSCCGVLYRTVREGCTELYCALWPDCPSSPRARLLLAYFVVAHPFWAHLSTWHPLLCNFLGGGQFFIPYGLGWGAFCDPSMVLPSMIGEDEGGMGRGMTSSPEGGNWGP